MARDTTPPSPQQPDPQWTSDPELIGRLLTEARVERGVEDGWRAARALGFGPASLEDLMPARGPRSETLTLAQTAMLIKYDLRTLLRWMEGSRPIPAAVLPALTEILGMRERARWQLYRLTLGDDPPRGVAAADPSRIPEAWKEFIYAQETPAHICDHAWNWAIANAALYRLLYFVAPGSARPGNNVMEMLLRPEAREIFVNWAEDWALPVFQEVWYSYLKCPTSRTLQTLVTRVTRDPELQEKLWLPRDDNPSFSPDASRRKLVHPDAGLVTVDLLTFEPQSLRHEGYRGVIFRFS
jgi:MmyB-like transcription regulator ligand binding domain